MFQQHRISRLVFCLAVFLAVFLGRNLTAQIKYEHHIGYPDPKRLGPVDTPIHGKAPAANVNDRYSKISEAERARRIMVDECRRECCNECPECDGTEPCPLCEEDPKTPCGKCKMCLAGFPCEKTLCRHCVQPRSMNMCNSCDLTAGDEPCGTCDACREHRSDPCEHADDGHGPRGEFNPYKEPRLFSVIPRPILDTYNNGARKYPVYYNPAPYYRPHWNPSMHIGYARPYTHRWSCPLCYKDPCDCDKPGFAGQVPYAYACKFCNRNPCACSQDICNVNKAMDPAGVSKSLTDMNQDSTRIQDREVRESRRESEATGERPLIDDSQPPEILQRRESEPVELDRGRDSTPTTPRSGRIAI